MTRIDCLYLLLQWNVSTNQCTYRLVASTPCVETRCRLEAVVADAVSRLEIPSPYRERCNALTYAWFNDGTMLARVRDTNNNRWRDLQAGDLPQPVVDQLAALLSLVTDHSND